MAKVLPRRRRQIAVGAALAVMVAAGAVVALNFSGFSTQDQYAGLPFYARERMHMIAGGNPADMARESIEAATLAEQFAQARRAPGIVAPGAYGAAFQQLLAMPKTGGSWSNVTRLPYDADDPRYRDYYSNSTGGWGAVTGRVTGLAADGAGHVYAAGANGGVWRSSTGGGNWTPIADGLPSLSTGALELAPDGSLWYATGEANTGGTSYVGSGVYRLANPTTGVFTAAMRVGGAELESTTIGKLRFGGGKVWAATGRGVYSHSLEPTGAWKLEYAPNPAYLPGGSQAGDPNAAYKNIVNDIAIDPRNPKHIIAAIGWRSGDTYNGFYETLDYTTGVWAKVNPGGAMPADDIGRVTFAYAADGSTLYAINQSPKLLNKPVGTVNSFLDGVYVSNNGSPAGPWTKIAESQKLANSGSALKQAVGGKGYGPGIQAWYNHFLLVDPADPRHVWVGLEEVYETEDGGSTWKTVGPYWNFSFDCWDVSDAQNRCPSSTHPDQHAATVGVHQGRAYFYAGNDGGVYRRPVRGATNGNGNGTDWVSMNDGTMDALQYYAVAVGRDSYNGVNGVGVTGGLQDNGASMVRPGDTVMGSHFGGDGGDVLANPDNVCQQVHEYVYLAMTVTENCAVNPGAVDPSTATSWRIQPYTNFPGDEPARFIAPFAADDKNVNQWVAAGQHVWFNTKGFAIRSGKEWIKGFNLGAGRTATAVAVSGGVAYVGWCGPCNNAGFARGIAVGKFNDPASWRQLNLPVDGTVPNRYISGFGVDPANPSRVFVAVNGFSRRFTEGPGVGFGHVFESTDMGATWTDVSANLPDVPAGSVKVLPGGALVLGTDLATFYRPAGATQWQVLGSGLPTTVVMDVEHSPADNAVYVATHGRGIWRFGLQQL
ncbi:WD40/YVTN/BNR-like repeat-containing protein [Allorhizocola rhizosphaerae]|uniref:WD40/YVTN/BNR-like repeat-containing protein n=1 Tax=Allorhizocola rhizosphaerae TaxID=1872709 RepID=UPI001B8D4654|nr:glycosyl hydrolase [Allorhizocola rhizosphaerae]